MIRLEERFETFSTALTRLKEAIDMYKDDKNVVLLDGTIQRFEFTVELAWKTIKEYLEYEKLGEFNSLRSAVKEAYKINLIEDGEKWLEMLDDRNLTRHTYDENTAKEIYRNIITSYYDVLLKFKEKMIRVIENEK